jgi:hypothetical protein
MQFLRLMFPDSPEYPQHPVFDLIHSNLTLALAQNAAKLPKDVYSIFSPWKYFDYNTGSQYQDLSKIQNTNKGFIFFIDVNINIVRRLDIARKHLLSRKFSFKVLKQVAR